MKVNPSTTDLVTWPGAWEQHMARWGCTVGVSTTETTATTEPVTPEKNMESIPPHGGGAAGHCPRCELTKTLGLTYDASDDAIRKAMRERTPPTPTPCPSCATLTRERDEAKAQLDAWREALVDVLGEPARDLDDPCAMACNVIRTLREDLKWEQESAAALRGATMAAHAELNLAGVPAAGPPDMRIRFLSARVRELEQPGELNSIHKLRAEVIARDEQIAALEREVSAGAGLYMASRHEVERVKAERDNAIEAHDAIRKSNNRDHEMPNLPAIVALLDALVDDYSESVDHVAVPGILRALRTLVDPTQTPARLGGERT